MGGTPLSSLSRPSLPTSGPFNPIPGPGAPPERGGTVSNIPAAGGPAPGTPAQGFAGPSGQQFQQLFQTLLGPEQSNPYGGTVSYEQARAKDPGLQWNDYHNKVNQWRDYAGKRDALMHYLMTKGYGLEDMGLQNRKEFGKHDFDMFGQGGKMTGQGELNPGYQYDWANGTKINTMTSDQNVRPEAITPQEMASHQKFQNLQGQGYNTYAQQLWAANKMSNGGKLPPGAMPKHERLNLDVLARRFGVDPAMLQQQFGQFGGAVKKPGGNPQGGPVPLPDHQTSGMLPAPPTGGSVTSAITGQGGTTPQAAGMSSQLGGNQASTGQAPASYPSIPDSGFGRPSSFNFSGPSFATRQSQAGRSSIMGLGNQKQGGGNTIEPPKMSGGF